MRQTKQSLAKGQPIRLLDVFVLGPWLVWLGARQDAKLQDWERLALVVAGGATIVYNGRNYMRIRNSSR